jgi:tetratricopeptide (TPR) repeat protein
VECDAGHLARCEAHLRRARPALERAVGPAHTGVAFLDIVAGRLALERGQAETAARHFDHALTIYAGAKSVNLRKVLALAGRARAHERLGLHDQARADADAAVTAASKLSSGLGYSEWLGQALLARAEVERAQGRAADARVSAGQALAQLRPAVGDASPVVARAQALLGAL